MGYTNLTGIDPSPKCVQNTRRLGINAYNKSISSLHKLSSKYDCVILSHVLEHIYDIKSGIKQIIDILVPNGLIYIEVPDATRYADYLVAPSSGF